MTSERLKRKMKGPRRARRIGGKLGGLIDRVTTATNTRYFLRDRGITAYALPGAPPLLRALERLEFYLGGSELLHAEVELDHPEIHLVWATPLCRVYVTLTVPAAGILPSSAPALALLLEAYTVGLIRSQRREVSLRMANVDGEPTLSWSLWNDPDCWNFSDPAWRRLHVNLRDLVTSRTRESTRVSDAFTVPVHMPEGTHEIECYAHVEQLATTVRGIPIHRSQPRLIIRWEASPGIPVPGKGTASWNCREDAICGSALRITDPSRGFELVAWEERDPASWVEACAAEVSSAVYHRVLETRYRYGGPRWAPGRHANAS